MVDVVAVMVSFIIIFGLVIIVTVFGIQSLRETQLGYAYILLGSKMKSSKFSGLAIPYMYLVMNLENFVKYYSHVENHGYGFFTFDFITALTGLKHWMAEYYNFDKFKEYITGYNTYPFFWPYYYDFGVAGLAVIPFIIGFIISEIYYRLRRYPNIIMLTIYTAAFAVIIISYTSDPLTRLDMMYNFGVIIFAQILFTNKVVKR